MELSLHLQQKQVLSQKMQQSAEILQMNTLALSEYIRTVSEENPLLDWSEEHATLPDDDKLRQKLEWLHDADEQNRGYYQAEMDNEKEREDLRFGKKDAQSLREYLLFQIHILPIEEKEKRVLTFLAESTEESGYLEHGALDAAIQKYHLAPPQALAILRRLQALDPPGVGARNLQECLLIQLKQKGASETACILAEQALSDIAKNRLSYLTKKLHISMAELTAALEEIRCCTPKPGSGFANSRPTEYIIPDVFVEKRGTELLVSTNRNTVPRLFINPQYRKLLQEDASQQTREYVAQKLRQAEWAVQCVERRESTLLETAKQIVAAQQEFFLSPHGSLQPLRMADIAEKIQMHESTVSRAVKDKYLQCDRGVFSLSFFFSKAIATTNTESVAVDTIQKQIAAIIQTEDKTKPLSDRELTERLTAAGIQISRRTVAKYRENMGIPGASGRRQYQ